MTSLLLLPNPPGNTSICHAHTTIILRWSRRVDGRILDVFVVFSVRWYVYGGIVPVVGFYTVSSTSQDILRSPRQTFHDARIHKASKILLSSLSRGLHLLRFLFPLSPPPPPRIQTFPLPSRFHQILRCLACPLLLTFLLPSTHAHKRP